MVSSPVIFLFSLNPSMLSFHQTDQVFCHLTHILNPLLFRCPIAPIWRTVCLKWTHFSLHPPSADYSCRDHIYEADGTISKVRQFLLVPGAAPSPKYPEDHCKPSLFSNFWSFILPPPLPSTVNLTSQVLEVRKRKQSDRNFPQLTTTFHVRSFI